MARHYAPLRGLESAAQSQLFQGRFGRMFRTLPPAEFGRNDAESASNLETLARLMVAGPESPKDGADEEEGGIPSLYTYLGQFIDHDITFDPASSLQKQNDPNSLVDYRTPAFDLDNVYGRGLDDQPYMYGKRGEFLFGDPLVGGNSLKYDLGIRDLPRARNGRAIIGDPRNDENTIVSQLQGLFMRFHNRALVEIKDFAATQQFVRFHYQYMILNDFLPRIVHDSVLKALKGPDGQYDRKKLEFYEWRNDPFMPVEFSVAAYRFGHSMVRPGYRLNDNYLVPIFPDLGGFRNLRSDFGIDWGRFIDIDLRSDADEARRLQLAYRIDTALADPLSKLPANVAGDMPSLPERNLKRGWRMNLPSGQTVARAIGVEPLREIRLGKAVDKPEAPLKEISAAGDIFLDNCPLWTYVLAEAMHHTTAIRIPAIQQSKLNTPQLGPVGGRIVAEVFLGLMFGDPNSMLSLHRNWTPKNPQYQLKDFVNYALGM